MDAHDQPSNGRVCPFHDTPTPSKIEFKIVFWSMMENVTYSSTGSPPICLCRTYAAVEHHERNEREHLHGRAVHAWLLYVFEHTQEKKVMKNYCHEQFHARSIGVKCHHISSLQMSWVAYARCEDSPSAWHELIAPSYPCPPLRASEHGGEKGE